MERFLLTMLVLAFFALLVWLMWRGWRRKARHQSAQYPPFPEVPEQLDASAARDTATGVYVATTSAGRWQDRIVARGVGMSGPATLRRYSAGVVVDRDGAPDFFIPAESLVDARLSKGMAGKVMGVDGLLVITWRLGDQLVDTGFRAEDKAAYEHWLRALLAMAPSEQDGQGHAADSDPATGSEQRTIEGRGHER
ncbi:transporter [Haloechinothrix sp. LS1_15]|uniref:PH-like domain-containing protein n=1 Tax=Haloechinothrix sp. LS1_15 TaxID=2652248 RepID=UPI00294B186B|nr:transporter [Haloechinothrix sp. LS1_15]